jgi:hypothetical protein
MHTLSNFVKKTPNFANCNFLLIFSAIIQLENDGKGYPVPWFGGMYQGDDDRR